MDGFIGFRVCLSQICYAELKIIIDSAGNRILTHSLYELRKRFCADAKKEVMSFCH